MVALTLLHIENFPLDALCIQTGIKNLKNDDTDDKMAIHILLNLVPFNYLDAIYH